MYPPPINPLYSEAMAAVSFKQLTEDQQKRYLEARSKISKFDIYGNWELIEEMHNIVIDRYLELKNAMKNKKRKKLKKPCNATFEPHCGMLSKERVRKGELAEYLTGKGGLCDHCGWLVEKHKLICHNHMPSNLIALGCYEKVDVITESDGWFKKTQTLIVKQKAL